MAKREAENCKKIYIWSLLKNYRTWNEIRCFKLAWDDDSDTYLSVLVDLLGHNKYIHLKYKYLNYDADKYENIDYKILLTSTKCYIGGRRFWFICPLTKDGKYCGKRVATLFQNGRYFGCRECNELTYLSRNKNRSKKRGPFISFLELDHRIDQIYQKRFNKFYKGKITKKYKRLLKLEGGSVEVSKKLISKNKL